MSGLTPRRLVAEQVPVLQPFPTVPISMGTVGRGGSTVLWACTLISHLRVLGIISSLTDPL